MAWHPDDLEPKASRQCLTTKLPNGCTQHAMPITFKGLELTLTITEKPHVKNDNLNMTVGLQSAREGQKR